MSWSCSSAGKFPTANSSTSSRSRCFKRSRTSNASNFFGSLRRRNHSCPRKLRPLKPNCRRPWASTGSAAASGGRSAQPSAASFWCSVSSSSVSFIISPTRRCKSSLELDALVAKYGRLDGVAYAFVQDTKGEVLVSSLQPFPTELKDAGGASAASRTTHLRGKTVYETRSPLLAGQLGVVRVGLWAETIQDDVRSTLLPIIGLIAGCLVLGIALSIMLASKTIRPILDLKAIADDISRGRLGTPP